MLFYIPLENKLVNNIVAITDNYNVIHHDEFPMLFTGTNDHGRIIGSLMCEDDNLDIYRYLHLMVSQDEYINFIEGKITYRALIEQQDRVIFVDKDDCENSITTYWLTPTDIPVDYLPHPDLLYPNHLHIQPLISQ